MTKATNVMSIAPNQPTTRRFSPNTQPKYKTPSRAGNKNFGSTLDKVQSKLDELKQNIQDLQDPSKKLAQVEGEQQPPPDTATETPAQGTSNTPQDATQKATGTAQNVMRNDSTPIADDVKPADIFFGKTESFDAVKVVDAPEAPTAQAPTQPSMPRAQMQPFDIQPPAPIEAAPVSLDGSADLVDEQPPTNFMASNVPAYLFNANTATLLETKPVAPVEVPKVDGVQNLMSVIPQADNSNAQSMLNMLGGKAWLPRNIQAQAQPIDVEQPATIQPTVQAQTRPIDVEQPSTIQPTVQAQTRPIDVEQPSTIQPTVQAQARPIDVEQPATIQPTVQAQAQPIDVEQPATIQPTVQAQAQPIDVEQPAQLQPTVQAQARPIDVEQPATIQPTVQAQARPVDVVQPAQVQPTIQAQARPIDVEQPAQIQPTVQAQARPIDVEQPAQLQPTIQAQTRLVDVVQPATIQPTVQAQAQPASVTLDPDVAPEVSTTQTLSPSSEVQPANVQPTVQTQTRPIDFAQPATIQPTVQAQAQPLIAPQRVDERPAQQIFSEMLGVNVQVEDAPTAAPVTAPQAPSQQFNQQAQRDAQQNFQGQQPFQATPDATPQPQAVATGGEVFAPVLTPTTDASQSQPTTPVQAPDAPPMPQDDFDVPAQIVRQARLIRTTESTEMIIKLNPEHLGELTLRVSVSANGAVNASFHSDNAQVRTIIENALVQIRQELNDAGLKVENVDVYAGLSEGGGLLNGQGGQAWQQGRQQRQGNRQTDLNTIERDVDATAPVNESTTDGVDYSV